MGMGLSCSEDWNRVDVESFAWFAGGMRTRRLLRKGLNRLRKARLMPRLPSSMASSPPTESVAAVVELTKRLYQRPPAPQTRCILLSNPEITNKRAITGRQHRSLCFKFLVSSAC